MQDALRALRVRRRAKQSNSHKLQQTAKPDEHVYEQDHLLDHGMDYNWDQQDL